MAEKEDEDEEGGSVRNRILIVGAGLTGRELYQSFNHSGFDVYVIEKNAERSMQKELGEHFIFGDASHPLILSRLNLDKTLWVINTSADPVSSRAVADQVAKIDSQVKVLVLSDKEGDRDFFVSHSGQMDPNVAVLIETRKEIAQSIFKAVSEESAVRKKPVRSRDKRSVVSK